MPDITMCSGGACTLANDCYRCKAKPNEHQSYFVAPPYVKKMGGTACEYYINKETRGKIEW